jgi:hypothetical protein
MEKSPVWLCLDNPLHSRAGEVAASERRTGFHKIFVNVSHQSTTGFLSIVSNYYLSIILLFNPVRVDTERCL